MNLQGKCAFVTGAGRGIGRGIALAFANAGCDIVAVARTASEIAETADEVRQRGGKALEVTCDVTSPKDVQSAVAKALDEFGRIDILVNNAGYARFVPLKDMTLDNWRQTLDVNMTGPFLCTQAVLPSMIAHGSGRIINISSLAGLKPYPHQGAYCASKHGLNGFTKVLAMELRPYGIGVHSICPGGIDTRLTREAMPERDKTDWMTPEDVAHAALYLATLSPRATTDEIVVRRFDSVPLGG